MKKPIFLLIKIELNKYYWNDDQKLGIFKDKKLLNSLRAHNFSIMMLQYYYPQLV